ncbi:hypothetical protein Taro_015324 [Colocasia esculenta]|uniref:Abietadienol/abietadienal oxidase n=1 Tax=Colocasia esculenta TaxID=4460 RepID=A0A843UH82_COLES|nr:hypothetical protein [Colocasia esculenta]
MAEQQALATWSSVLALVALTFLLLKVSPRKRKKLGNPTLRLPPGGRSWPLIGDNLDWYAAVSGSHPPAFVESKVKRYGKIFSCSLFGRRTVVSVDPSFNRFIMQNEGKAFQSSYPKSFRDLVGKNGVIVVQGEQQRRLHRIATSMMKLERLNLGLLEDIQKVMLRTLDSFQDDQVVVLQDVAINQMVNQLLGVSSQSETSEMAHLFSDFVDGCLSIPINLPGLAYHTAMKARETIMGKINQMTEAVKLKHGSTVENGVLGRLIEEENLSTAEIADFIINLLFAGNETTAKTMLFAVYFLTRCPEAFREVMAEQERLRSTNHLLSWEDYKAMPFTQCVIDETLRLGGIAIWLMREAKEDVEYGGFFIPKGFLVVPFLSAVHMDEDLYPRALDFNPWRWIDDQNKEKRNWRTSPFYSPFGGGARLCPGAELARLQIALFLHYFVTRYRWVISSLSQI